MTGPSVAEERESELRSRGVIATPAPWRSNGPVLAAVFFFLTAAAMLASWAFLRELLNDGKIAAWIVAVAAIALAETIIHVRRQFGTGVESALWLGGLFCVIFGLPGEGSPEAILLFAAASLIAGLRMRNPLFVALALAFVAGYLADRGGDRVALALGVTVAVIALAAIAREWRRPSKEMTFIVLLVVAPIIGAVAGIDRASAEWATVFAALAALSLAAGVVLRHHAPFIASVVNLSIALAILEMHDLLPFTEEWRLIVGGAVLMIVSAIVARTLRDRSEGVVVSPAALTEFDEELQMFGTVALQPRVDAATPREGGDFGGAGATGKF